MVSERSRLWQGVQGSLCLISDDESFHQGASATEALPAEARLEPPQIVGSSFARRPSLWEQSLGRDDQGDQVPVLPSRRTRNPVSSAPPRAVPIGLA